MDIARIDGWMTDWRLSFSYGPTVFAHVGSFRSESTFPIKRQLFGDRPVRAVKLNSGVFVGDFHANVDSTPASLRNGSTSLLPILLIVPLILCGLISVSLARALMGQKGEERQRQNKPQRDER